MEEADADANEAALAAAASAAAAAAAAAAATLACFTCAARSTLDLLATLRLPRFGIDKLTSVDNTVKSENRWATIGQRARSKF